MNNESENPAFIVKFQRTKIKPTEIPKNKKQITNRSDNWIIFERQIQNSKLSDSFRMNPNDNDQIKSLKFEILILRFVWRFGIWNLFDKTVCSILLPN